MISKEELSHYYKEKIYPGLISIEAKRKSILKFLKFFRYSLFISLVAYIVFFRDIIVPQFFPLSVIGLVLLFLITYFIVAAFKKRAYKKVFKPGVVLPILEVMGSNIEYKPKKHLDCSDIKKAKILDDYSSLEYSGLKHTDFEKCKGDDYVKGIFNGISLEFSDLLLTREIRSRGSEDNGKHIETMFGGLFFIAELKTEVQEGFCMVSKYEREAVGGFLGGLAKVGEMISGLMDSGHESIECGEERLDKQFIFYGNKKDMISLFREPVIKALLDLWSKEFFTRISLRRNKLYIGLDIPNKNFLEAKLSQSLEDYQEPMDVVSYIQKVTALVKSFQAKDEDIEMEW